MNLALWLKGKGLRADQVQAFYPSPMATATTMYHTERNPLSKVDYKSEKLEPIKGERQRRLHKAFLRYHDPKNWPMLRDALTSMGRADLIGYSKKHLVPPTDPIKGTEKAKQFQGKARILTQHTGLPPRGKPKAGNRTKSKKRA